MAATSASDGQSPVVFSGSMIAMMIVYFVLAMISFLFIFGWVYSIGIGLRKYIPEGAQRRTGFFKFSIYYPLIYFFFFFIWYFLIVKEMIASSSYGEPPAGLDNIFGYFAIIVPFHFFAVVCFVYGWRYAARTIKSVELRRRARVGDYLGYFFMVWFFPIGIWILQPRINAIIVSKEERLAMGDEEILDA